MLGYPQIVQEHFGNNLNTSGIFGIVRDIISLTPYFIFNLGEEIIEWVKLLEPLDSTKQRVEDQTFYAELISSAIIDPN